MDPKTLSAPSDPLTVPVAREWVKAFQKAHPKQGQDAQGWVQGLSCTRPAGVSEHQVDAFVRWLDANGLRQAQGEGIIFSMRGVSFLLSHDRPRLSPSEAWGHAAQLLETVGRINRAPSYLAPMRIDDVLLFGSMADPHADSHGDLDAILVLSPKHPGANQKAEEWFREQGIEHALVPEGARYPSFRKMLVEWFGEGQPFLSLDDQARTVGMLLGQDEGFSCYSLIGKSWGLQALRQGTVDDFAPEVLEALENGLARPSRRAHVARSLARAQSEMRAKLSSPGPTQGHRADRAAWWSLLEAAVPLSSTPSPSKAPGKPSL